MEWYTFITEWQINLYEIVTYLVYIWFADMKSLQTLPWYVWVMQVWFVCNNPARCWYKDAYLHRLHYMTKKCMMLHHYSKSAKLFVVGIGIHSLFHFDYTPSQCCVKRYLPQIYFFTNFSFISVHTHCQLFAKKVRELYWAKTHATLILQWGQWQVFNFPCVV